MGITLTKGGVGKTTTSVYLDTGLADRNRRTLLVGLDPQAHTTCCFLSEAPKRAVSDLINGETLSGGPVDPADRLRKPRHRGRIRASD